jgi:hypothetical protein
MISNISHGIYFRLHDDGRERMAVLTNVYATRNPEAREEKFSAECVKIINEII